MGYAEELFLVCMTLLLMYSWMKPRSRADLLARRRSSRRRLQVAVLANSDHPLHFTPLGGWVVGPDTPGAPRTTFNEGYRY